MNMFTIAQIQAAVNSAAEGVGMDMREGKQKELVKAAVRSFVRNLNAQLFQSEDHEMYYDKTDRSQTKAV
jgi:hypothetical protein